MAEPNRSLKPDVDDQDVDFKLLEAIPNVEREVVDIEKTENCPSECFEVSQKSYLSFEVHKIKYINDSGLTVTPVIIIVVHIFAAYN